MTPQVVEIPVIATVIRLCRTGHSVGRHHNVRYQTNGELDINVQWMREVEQCEKDEPTIAISCWVKTSDCGPNSTGISDHARRSYQIQHYFHTPPFEVSLYVMAEARVELAMKKRSGETWSANGSPCIKAKAKPMQAV